jgi:predicted PurR-regulated permease PerM
MAIGHSVLQMSFAAFIAFFLYRDGDALMQRLRDGLTKLVGTLGEELLLTIHDTVAGVVRGIFGAALAQAFVATAGFLIAGVPGAVLLGVATFFLSILPIGPPLVWGGCQHLAFLSWLLWLGDFHAFVGRVCDQQHRQCHQALSHPPWQPSVAAIDSSWLTGGIAAFGFIGLFIGPPILAVGLTLVRLWTVHPVKAAENSTKI